MMSTFYRVQSRSTISYLDCYFDILYMIAPYFLSKIAKCDQSIFVTDQKFDNVMKVEEDFCERWVTLNVLTSNNINTLPLTNNSI